MSEKIEMSELQTTVDLDRELDEHNAGLAKFNLKLAERLANYHRDMMTIGIAMTACGTGILGYFGSGRVMSIKDITTAAGAIVGLGYCVGVLISNNTTFLNFALQTFTCEPYYRFGSFLAPLSIRLITSTHYLSERNVAGTKMSEKIEMKEDHMKLDLNRELVE